MARPAGISARGRRLGRNPNMDTKTSPTTVPTTPPPKVGDDIYVGTALYLSHGVDDFHGGLCKISKVKPAISAGKPEWFISVEERPGWSYNYASLLKEQAELKAQYGETRGYPDPDNSPESNSWW